jgi:hypothetical protein
MGKVASNTHKIWALAHQPDFLHIPQRGKYQLRPILFVPVILLGGDHTLVSYIHHFSDDRMF